MICQADHVFRGPEEMRLIVKPEVDGKIPVSYTPLKHTGETIQMCIKVDGVHIQNSPFVISFGQGILSHCDPTPFPTSPILTCFSHLV